MMEDKTYNWGEGILGYLIWNIIERMKTFVYKSPQYVIQDSSKFFINVYFHSSDKTLQGTLNKAHWYLALSNNSEWICFE